MTRLELVETLAKYCIFPIASNWKIAVLMPSWDDCTNICQEVKEKLNEVPAWMTPDFLKKKTLNEIKTDNGHVMFIHNTTRLKGYTLNSIYYSSRINVTNNEDVEFFSFLAALSGSPLKVFDDE